VPHDRILSIWRISDFGKSVGFRCIRNPSHSYTRRIIDWIGFCHTGPISLCIDLFVFICVYLFHTAWLLYYCEHGGVDLMGLKPNP